MPVPSETKNTVRLGKSGSENKGVDAGVKQQAPIIGSGTTRRIVVKPAR
jgi:hypothetical protein